MRIIAVLAASLLSVGIVHAQTYPSRPVKMIVPWPPGQATDIVTRMVGEKLQEAFGQPFVIDNKPGASGTIGTIAVINSAPDGYTLLAASSGPVSILPLVQKLSYDPLQDLAPVSLTALGGFVLVTSPTFPAANAREFVALLRANPEKYTFASSGIGSTSHLVIELFNSMAEVKTRHVPYKGSAPGLTDVMNGQVAYTLETVASVVGHVRSGRLKALGLTTKQLTAALPEVPSLSTAADLPDYDIGGWIGVAAPRGTPSQIASRVSQEIQRIVQLPDIKERFLAFGQNATATTPEDMTAFLRGQQERFGAIVREANIKLE
ncbi:MAG: tripartite tricarboxylate transporter substrate binding protein [Betaproteobacteria bacterium]|nr:tripartite tricarboxylate transporter substrate binding protein [Betaproteobacteria bacterium]